MNWENLIRDYIRSKKLSGCKESTLYKYEKNLEFLLLKNGILDNGREHFLQFWVDLKDRVGDWRFTHLVIDLKQFVKWASKRIELPKWLLIELESLKPVPKSKIKERLNLWAYSAEEEQKILDACKTVSERFLWWLALNTGLRRKELMSLELKDISEMGVRVRAEVSKTGKERFVPFTSDQVPKIGYFLKHRLLFDLDSPYLFVNRNGRQLRLDHSSGSDMLKRLTKEVGFRVSWHNARYTFAVRTWKESGDIRLVMALLGHSDPKMTERYLRIKKEDEPEILREKLERARRRYQNEK